MNGERFLAALEMTQSVIPNDSEESCFSSPKGPNRATEFSPTRLSYRVLSWRTEPGNG